MACWGERVRHNFRDEWNDSIAAVWREDSAHRTAAFLTGRGILDELLLKSPGWFVKQVRYSRASLDDFGRRF
jgi:hypothetical protein